MDLIHPHSVADVAEVMRSATARRRRLLIVGGRQHIDRGNPCEADAEVWTTLLNGIVAYDPAEMIAVVGAGVRVRDLRSTLTDGGQEWPVDAPGDATVGGVVAAGVSSPRRLRVGHVRDTVVEMKLVTGDGRLVRSGARTVKNVTGYDLHRLATGSLGTLGCIVQVALKVRPLPKARRTLVFDKGGALGLGRLLLETIPLPTAVLASPGRVEIRLEGWPAEVEEQTAAARSVTEDLFVVEDGVFPAQPVDEAPVVVEASLPPSRIAEVVSGREDWSALLGVGTVWFRLPGIDALEDLRRRAGASARGPPTTQGGVRSGGHPCAGSLLGRPVTVKPCASLAQTTDPSAP